MRSSNAPDLDTYQYLVSTIILVHSQNDSKHMLHCVPGASRVPWHLLHRRGPERRANRALDEIGSEEQR